MPKKEVKMTDMLTVQQAAEIAERDDSTLRNAILNEQLEVIRISPRRMFVTREALKKWMAGPYYGKPGPKPKKD